MWPSDSRHVRASRTTWRLPSTACSMLSVSWSKVFLNQSACCWEIVTRGSFRGSPEQGCRFGGLVPVGATARHLSSGPAEVEVGRCLAVGVEGAVVVRAVVERAVDLPVREVLDVDVEHGTGR